MRVACKAAISAVIVLSILCATGYAQEKPPLGNGSFVLKFDYISFTDQHFDTNSGGVYLGMGGYMRLNRDWIARGNRIHLYLGAEIGIADNASVLGEDIDFIPIELNFKLANEVAQNLIIDYGAGLSYSYTEVTYHSLFADQELERDDWLLGGQIFADLSYHMGFFSIGCNAKYQITEGFKEADADLSNWRLGAQIGVTF